MNPIAPALFGWMVASFLTTLLVGLVLALAGGHVAMIASFGAILLSFAAGGWLAGRLASRAGVLHGALVAAWTFAFTFVGTLFENAMIGVMLSPFAIRWDALSPSAVLGLAGVGVVMLVGAAVGGAVAVGFHFGKFKPRAGSSSRGMHQ